MFLPADSPCTGRVSLHFTYSGFSMFMSAGVVVDEESEYILVPSGLRALDGRLHGGVWVRVVSW